MMILKFQIFEGKVEDLQAKFSNISEDKFQELVAMDMTATKKYLEKLIKFFLEGYETYVLKDLIETYDNLIQKNILLGKDRDINSFKNFQDFEDVVNYNRYKKSKNQKERTAKEGAEIILDDDKMAIRHIISHEASKKFGKGTTWCITMNSDGHWRNYYGGQMLDFYFIEFKKKKDLGKYKKIAIGVNTKDELVEIRDIYDKTITVEKLQQLTGLDVTFFKNKFKEEAKNVEELIQKIERVGFTNYKIVSVENSIVDVDADLKIKINLPFTIRKWIGTCTLEKENITSKDVPLEIDGSLILRNCQIVDTIINCNHLIINGGKIRNTTCNCDKLHIIETDIKSLKELHLTNVQDIKISMCNLKDLEGSPKEISDNFLVYSCDLKTLKGGPERVGKNYDVKLNDLKSLEGLATYIGTSVNLRDNLKNFTEEEVKAICQVPKIIID